MAEGVAEPFGNPHRPGGASRAEQLIREFRIDFRSQSAVPEFRAETPGQVLSASMLIAPLRPAMHQGVPQGDQAISVTERGPSLVERFGVGHDEGELVLVKDRGPGRVRPEMRRNGQHSPSPAGVAVGHVILDFEVQLIDRRLEEGSRGQYGADDIGAMAANDVRIRRAGVFLLDLTGEIGHVPRREQVVAVQARRDLCRRLVGRFGRYGYRDIRVQ